MTRTAAIVLSLVMLFGVVTLASGQQSNDAALVQQFFPQSLLDEATADFNAGGPAPFQSSSFVAADLNGSGKADFLVAAYTNGFSAVVRVLQKQKNSAVVADEPRLPLMAGIYSSVSLIDIDNDGRPEVVIGLSSAKGAVGDWIFKWDGTHLSSIGPTIKVDKNTSTLLGDADFVDLNGNGILAIVNPPEFDSSQAEATAPLTLSVFTLNGGTFVPSNSSFNFFKTFVRHRGDEDNDTECENDRSAPEDGRQDGEHRQQDCDEEGPSPAATATFSVANPNGTYVMTVVNGDGRDRRKRVRKATIKLNGVVVADDLEFEDKVTMVKIAVAVTAANVLVLLCYKCDSALRI